MTQKIVTIYKIEGNWMFGTAYNPETDITQNFMKLTDDAYERLFWFLKTPKQYFEEHKSVSIDEKTSDSLINMFEEKWIDFCYLVSTFKTEKIEEIIKIFLGPIAQFSKENKKSPLECVSLKNLFDIINDTLSFNEKKNIILEIMSVGGDYQDVRKKHVFEGVSDDIIENSLKEVISNNESQWTKAKLNSNLMNWFVGQIMKQHKGKINAANVMTILNKLKDEI